MLPSSTIVVSTLCSASARAELYALSCGANCCCINWPLRRRGSMQHDAQQDSAQCLCGGAQATGQQCACRHPAISAQPASPAAARALVRWRAATTRSHAGGAHRQQQPSRQQQQQHGSGSTCFVDRLPAARWAVWGCIACHACLGAAAAACVPLACTTAAAVSAAALPLLPLPAALCSHGAAAPPQAAACAPDQTARLLTVCCCC